MMKSVYSTFMVARNVMSLVTMVWTPFIQFKGFLLSFLGVLINLSRLVLQMRALDRMEHMQKKQSSESSEHHIHMSHPALKYTVRDYGDTGHHFREAEEHKDPHQIWGNDHGDSLPVNGDHADSWSSHHPQNYRESSPGIHHQPSLVRSYIYSDSYLDAAYRH